MTDADASGAVDGAGRDGLLDGGPYHEQVQPPQHRPLHRRLLRQAPEVHRHRAPRGR